jgi:hypothetical protein
MVRLLVDRSAPGEEYDAHSRRHLVIETGRVKRCGTCTFEVPEMDIVVEDGQERCPMCRDTLTSEWLSAEEQNVAAIMSDAQLALVSPPQFSVRPLTESRPGAITRITTSSGTDITSNAPLILVRTVAVVLKLLGVNLSSSVTFTYPANVTDSVAPSYTSTLITLTLIAAAPAVPGTYDLSVSDGITTNAHLYPRFLRII